MSEYVSTIQADIVGRAKKSDPDWHVTSLHPALRSLRESYSTNGMPDFSLPNARLAYALAYHPFHSLMSFEVMCQMRHMLPVGRNGVFTVVSLGAGAGAEALAVLRVLAGTETPPSTVRLILVDKEPGWERTRATTLGVTGPRWFGGLIEVEHVVADLSTDEGRSAAFATFGRADLIIAQAILSEIRTGSESVSLLADLVAGFPAESLLLLCDFTGLSGLTDWVDELDDHPTLRTVMATTQSYPMPISRGEVAELFKNEDGLRQRRRVSVTARLYSRPGWRPNAVQSRPSFVPTADQAEVLEAFRAFVTDESSQVFVLEGPAGSGKTEIMREMAVICTAEGQSVSLHAPTGQAAVRLTSRTGITASTIHSGLYAESRTVDNDTDGVDWPPTIEFSRQALGGSGCVTLIDEASMIGDEPDEDEVDPPELRFNKGQLLTDIIDGTVHNGGKVVFIGDGCQLPPYKEDRSPALSVDELAMRGLRVVHRNLSTVVRVEEGSELSEVTGELRQRVLDFQKGLMQIQPREEGNITVLRSHHTEQFLLDLFASGDAVALAVRNKDVAQWNASLRLQLGRNSELPEHGDRLVTTKGSQSHGLLNGTELSVVALMGNPVTKSVSVRRSGEVVRLSADLQRAELSFSLPSGMSLEFEAHIIIDVLGAPDKDVLKRVRLVLWVDYVQRMRKKGIQKKTDGFWEGYEFDDEVNAIHATYSYARSLFRAQGGEWNSVIVDGQSLLPVRESTHRQAYSAITRTKKSLYLRNWPKPDERWSEDRLTKEPMSILQQLLQRPVSYRRINEQNDVLAVQLYTTDDQPNVTVNVFERADGDVNLNIQGSPKAEIPGQLRPTLEYWREYENARGIAVPPVQIASGMSSIEEVLRESGHDFFCQPSGDWQVEVRLFAQDLDWVSARLNYNGNGQVTRIFREKGSPRLGQILFENLKGTWPAVRREAV